MTSNLRLDSAAWLRQAAGELVLIVVGVSVALAFGNWNTERSAQAQERRFLLEISSDLEATRVDLARDINSTTISLERLETILDWIGGANVPDSLLDRQFEALSLSSLLYAERAAYESLKSVGLDRISSDSVRAGITSIYELGLIRVLTNEDRRDAYTRDVVEPFVRARFRYSGDKGLLEGRRLQVGAPVTFAPMAPMTPLDRPELRRNTEFEIMCRTLLNRYADVLSNYRQLDTEIGQALEILAAQLK